MPKPRIFSVLLLALLFIAGSASQAQLAVEASEPPVHELSRDDQVRALYTEVAANLQAAGHDLTLEVHNLATVPRGEFGRYKTYQVFSLGEGLCLRIEPMYSETNVQMPDGSSMETDSFVTFDLDWKPDYWLMHADAERAELFQSIRTQNFADYIETAAQDDDRLETVEAVTSFEVHLRFEGRERVYRAMTVWFSSGSAEPQFILVDRILLQLDSAFDPTLPIRSVSALDAQPEIPNELLSGFRQDIPGMLENATTECSSTIKRHNNFNSLVGTEEHSGTGKHRSIVGVEFECTCTTNCASTCRPSFDSLTCDDQAPLASGRKHVASTAQKAVSDQVVLPDSLTSGAKNCAAGFGCVFRSCLLSSTTCDVSVSVSIDGSGGLGFSSTGASYELNMEFNFAGCAPCQPNTNNCLILGGDALCGDDPQPIPDFPCTGACLPTPIVIDVARDGFRFSGLAAAVMFDIDADGSLDQITWTDPTSDDAFLVLDRNQNQVIDDGRELFGAVTEQPETEDRNGFLALAVFDKSAHGGNGDGVVTPEDAIFESLRLWKDENQDGISQPAELRSLHDSGIFAIELSYITSGRRDRYGNVLRWTSFVHFADDTSRLAAADVIFVPVE